MVKEMVGGFVVIVGLDEHVVDVLVWDLVVDAVKHVKVSGSEDSS